MILRCRALGGTGAYLAARARTWRHGRVLGGTGAYLAARARTWRHGIEVSTQCLGAMMFCSAGNPDYGDSVKVATVQVDLAEIPGQRLEEAGQTDAATAETIAFRSERFARSRTSDRCSEKNCAFVQI